MHRPNTKIDQILEGCAKLAKKAGAKTHQEIADACGVSKALILAIEQKALRKLRHPTRIKQLKEYKV